MKNFGVSLQNVVLNALREQKIEITLYTTNGVSMKGLVFGFDDFIIILTTHAGKRLVYKHAISTIQMPNDFKIPERRQPQSDK